MARRRSKGGQGRRDLVALLRPGRTVLPILAGVLALALVGLWLSLGTGWGQRHFGLARSAAIHAPSKPPAPESPKAESGAREAPGSSLNQEARLHPPEKEAPPVRKPGHAARSGSAPWRANAVPAAILPGRPMIAIVIDDVGVDRRRSERALALPAPLTMAFLPYARDLPRLTAAAHARGHELLVHVPMEPVGGEKDAGPEPLRDDLSAEEMRRRLDWMLSRFGSYVGINNHMGSRLTQDPRAMRIVLEDLSERGLLFLDSRTTAETVGAKLGRELGLPVVERDVFLDNDEPAERVREKLKETERVAEKKGHAIAIGHPHDGTLEALAAWLPEVQARGFVLVPVSAIVLEQERIAKANGHMTQ